MKEAIIEVWHDSVHYDGHNYGGVSPCSNSLEIKEAINHAKETIREEGETWKIIDHREICKLSNWIEPTS